MAPINEPSHLANPLALSTHLETSASRLDGVPKDLEDSIRFETARLLQTAGVLLRLPREIVAQSIILLYRFWTGPDGGSMLEHDSKDVAATALYLTAKPSPHVVSPRQTLITFSYIHSLGSNYAVGGKDDSQSDITGWHLSEGKYESARNQLYEIESHILRILGFQTHVALPYTLCINYLQTLDAFQSSTGSTLARRAFAHINTALLSPQLLLLTHQPSSIATAAIYLAAREVNAKLPETEWWEVFDVDREELGFLVVALRSVEGFAVEEKRKWGRRRVPLTVEELQAELERTQMMDAGE